MKILGLALVLLLASGLPAFGADEAKDAADPVKAALVRVTKMQPAAQQAWLRRLEQRAARVAQLTLAPDDAAKQQAKTRSQLHQKMVTWQTLYDVLDDTSTREKAAVDYLVKRYQRAVFDTFHAQLDVYGQRQQAWRDVESAWKAAGSPIDERDRLIEWLDAAIRSATPNAVGPIPQKPKFQSVPPAEDAVKLPVTPKTESSKEPPATPKSENPAKPVEPAPAKDPPRAAEVPLPAPEPAAASPAPSPAAASIPLQRHATDQQAAAEKPTAKALANPAATPARRPEPKPQVAAEKAPQLPRREAQAIAAVQPKAADPAVRPVAAVERPKKSQKPLPARGESPTDEKSAAEPVEIQQDELAARIGGCNLAIRALETDLDESGAWTAARLEPLMDRLKILVVRRNDLQLFREAVPERQRSSLAPVASAKGVVSQLAAHVFEARSQLSGSGYKGTDSERQAELKRLDELSRQLAELGK